MREYIAMPKKTPAFKRTVVETARIVTNFTGSDSALKSVIDKQGREKGGPGPQG